MVVNCPETEGLIAAPPTRCLRIAAVAEILDLSVSSVRRLIRDGRLDAVRIGASVRVTESSLDALLKTGTQRSKRRAKKEMNPSAMRSEH